jgi:hypothetical protein
MFVVDFLTAFLLSVAFTIVFAGEAREHGYRAWRQMSALAWLLTLGSWVVGMVLVGFGARAAHWIPFLLSGLALGLVGYSLVRARRSKRALAREAGEPGNDARPAIALYFCVTLLLFFCAISLRFYIVNFG